jgi:hypothetical protein
MTELQLVLLYTATIVLRIPRIKERWVAPLMRGPEWFFDVGVAPDFLKGPGATLLRNYRWRLFIPWSIEGLALTGLWLTGRNNAINILVLIMGITLFTRFNYYAARLATENRTRRFEQPDANQPTSNVVLSLQPRTLPSYTNWWVEAGIALALSAAAGWLAYLAATSPDPALPRRLVSLLIVNMYGQVGLLLVKSGVIRSGGAAPADNVEQYLAWRESLRRLTTAYATSPDYCSRCSRWWALTLVAGGSTRLAATIGFGGAFILALGVEWRSRLVHLKVARRTWPAKFPLLPAAQKARGL